MSLPTVHKITNLDVVKEIKSCAAKDDHYVLAPTHVVKKDGEIAGYWSINGVPSVHLWHDSSKITARDSTHLVSLIDHSVMEMDHRVYVITCASSSPYFPHMERFGFKPVFQSNLLIKEIPT
jgi:hypothetical protein